MTKICIICNKEFQSKTKSKTCSRSCRASLANKNRYKDSKENRVCFGCGKKFEISKKSNRKYCSKYCFNANRNFSDEWRINRSKHAIQSNKNRKKKGIFICKKCNKIFEYNTSLIAHKSYCNKPSQEMKCNLCDKTFSSERGLKIHNSLVHCKKEKKIQRSKNISKKALNRRFANVSLQEKEFLIKLVKIFNDTIHSFQIEENTHKYDFYIPSINLIIEFDGDYWHGNKQNQKLTKRMKQQRKIDETYTREAIKKGFQIIRVWSSSSNEFILKLKEKKNAGTPVLQNWIDSAGSTNSNLRHFCKQ